MVAVSLPAPTLRRSRSVAQTKIAPTFGLGLNFYLNNWLSLGLEYRAFPFASNRAGFDSRGTGNDGKFLVNKIDSQGSTPSSSTR